MKFSFDDPQSVSNVADMTNPRTIECPTCHGKGRIPEPREFAASLRKKREAAGVSLRSVAKEMQISAPYLSDMECGHRPFPADRVESFDGAIKKLSKPTTKRPNASSKGRPKSF